MLLTCMMVLALQGSPSNCVSYSSQTSISTGYEVRKNDTLRALSVEFLGTRNRTEIAHSNGMGTGHGLHTGRILAIPVHSMAEYRLLVSKRHSTPTPLRERIVAANLPRASGANPGILAHYNCAALESLWNYAGGNSSHAFMAAEIATAESGGNPNAYSPTNDVGLWQINRTAWGSMATYDPYRNARSAISISRNGTNWSPWTTYTSGAYYGRC